MYIALSSGIMLPRSKFATGAQRRVNKAEAYQVLVKKEEKKR
jgi:hypothetical protein